MLMFREYTTFPFTTGAFSFSVWLALMISLDSHSNREPPMALPPHDRECNNSAEQGGRASV